jgi:hypothetical protein
MNFLGGIIRRRRRALDWVLFDQDDFAGAAGPISTTDGARSYGTGFNSGVMPRIDGSGNLIKDAVANVYRWAEIDVGNRSHACEIQFISDTGTNTYPLEVHARIVSSGSYIVANYDRTDGKIHLYKKIIGVYTELGNYAHTLAANDRIRLEVIRDGSSDDVYVKVNDATVISVADQTGLPDSNHVGVALYYAQPKYDNIKWWLYQ